MTTLARLSFWISAEQIDAFEAAYQRQLVPILNRHGLDESIAYNRSAIDGVYNQLFAVETPARVVSQTEALAQEPAWQQALQGLGATFGTEDSAALRYHLGTYQTPAGPGTTVQVGPGSRQGLWHSFGSEDGLPTRIGDLVGDLIEDRQGALWLAQCPASRQFQGEISICRFDGAQSTVWTTADGLVNDRVQTLLQDRYGHLWLGTQGGVSRFDGQTFESFTTADGLVNDWVNTLLEDRHGRLWVGTKGGISYFEDGTLKPFAGGHPLAAVQALLEDRRGHLWFGTATSLTGYDGQRFNTYSLPDQGTKIFCLTEDRLGGLWVGTPKGLYRFADGQFALVTDVPTLPIRDLLEDAEGHLWCAVSGDGIYGFDRTQWTHFTTEDGLISDWTLALATDRQGQLWVETNIGLSRYESNVFTHWTMRTGLPDNLVRDMTEDSQGRLWVSCNTGVCRFDGQTFALIEALQGRHGWSSSAVDRQGHLWFGTDDDQAPSVIRYDGAQYTPFTTADGLAGNRVFRVLADQRGHVWFTFLDNTGISRYDGRQFHTFTTADGLPHKRVYRLAEDRQGHLWFDTWGGVCRFDGKAFTTYPFKGGLLLWDRRGHLWSMTFRGDGMFRYDGRQLEAITSPVELTRYRVHYALEDRQGHLWFGTFGGGVFRYDGRIFQRLSRREGLLSNQIEALCQDRQGAVWIGTAGGLTRYRSSAVPPTVCLSAIIADRRYAPEAAIAIPASQQLVVFEFLGKSLSTSLSRMAYVYRLESYDADWQPAYTGRAEYQDLPEGEYTFQVQAVDRDFNYSQVAQVQVTVEPDSLVAGLNEALRQSGPGGEFVGTSPALRNVQQQLRQVALNELTVLIFGETGTGKGLAARTLHGWSPRAEGPFLTVNCGAIPESLIESELFGHEKGAFTSAHHRKLGKVDLAKGGTLFLDEIGDLPLAAQGKLLRLLEERQYERVGGTQTLTADMRIVAATNRDLQQMVAEEHFRSDLYFRLAVFPVQLPPLRQRREDIELLALHFLEHRAAHLDKAGLQLSPAALAQLQAYAWPGNVRELEHVIQRAIVVTHGSVLLEADLGLADGLVAAPLTGRQLTLEEHERQYIQAVLDQTDWVIKGPKGAAVRLGLSATALRRRIEKLNLRRP